MKKFPFFIYSFFSNRQRKRKRAEKDRPRHGVKGAFCLFVCLCFFEGNDVDMRRKEIRVDRVYTY